VKGFAFVKVCKAFDRGPRVTLVTFHEGVEIPPPQRCPVVEQQEEHYGLEDLYDTRVHPNLAGRAKVHHGLDVVGEAVDAQKLTDTHTSKRQNRKYQGTDVRHQEEKEKYRVRRSYKKYR
jgi:hypothetical protein